MAVSELTSNNAFIPGADLWIVPDFKDSKWAHKIDWYLGFQMHRMQEHQFQKISDRLTEIIDNEEFDYQASESITESKDRLFVTKHKLPNQYLLQMPFNGSVEDWLGQGREKALNLKVKSLRFFLPTKTTENSQWLSDFLGNEQELELSYLKDQNL